tara:strand:+ start:191 stop:1357 length:1167 start_codon:yes stop_codon:yes gene_type:complete
MPFFSFLINSYADDKFISSLKNIDAEISPKRKYYSKNTNLWRILNNKKNKKFVDKINIENRNKIRKINDKILFCLPPNIGLGDAVEYALGIKSIVKNKNLKGYGIAFTNKYKILFNKYFKLNNVFENVISYEDIKKFKTIFHFTLEIKQFKFQKYDRKNIEKLIVNHFKTKLYRFEKKNIKIKKIDKITIFPISKSPIRTMPIDLLNYIISSFSKDYKIEIILDYDPLSEFINNKIILNKNVNCIFPKNLKTILSIIKNTSYGVFMDSGPLHFAKINNVKGILIISSVKKNILLNKFDTIKTVTGEYKSEYCNGPCGLTNAFYYNNRSGCYDSLKIKKNILLKYENIKELQRGNLKNNYTYMLKNNVNCLKSINKIKVVQIIRDNIEI